MRLKLMGEGCTYDLQAGKEFETVENCFYLMTQGGLYDGRGLILGPNNPFKKIPIFVMIL